MREKSCACLAPKSPIVAFKSFCEVTIKKDCPFVFVDNVSAMVFYAKETGKFFNYISYARTYDNWNFYLIGFWNPENNLPIGIKPGGRNLFAGKGVQLMASFNF